LAVLGDVNAEVLFHMNHVLFDGMTVRELVRVFFHTLASAFSDEKPGNHTDIARNQNMKGPTPTICRFDRF
jgi:hypothetical protein